MEFVTDEIDLQDWEILSEEDGSFQSKDLSQQLSFSHGGRLDVNYFVCPIHSPRLRQIREEKPPPLYLAEKENRIVGSVVEKDPPLDLAEPTPQTVPVTEVKLCTGPPVFSLENLDREGSDLISQVFLKKMEEPKFVDTTSMDGHRSIDPIAEENQRKADGLVERERKRIGREASDPIGEEKGDLGRERKTIGWDGCVNIWRWRITGIGTLCSLGMAAATISIIIFGRQKHKQHHQNHKLRFHIYAEDKGFKRMVEQATRLNDAISAVRGAPLNRAQITFGGCYDGI
ncbi:uncharacterized protein LOC18448812 [Amborella trichopoda]|uniref:DUF6821 domain-containing protein n=1 Tax=Amborella trichopoda TaxID=13333 RepID=U5D460_AMBTC|nr:uncharacterized protein LOC18448812 [Amborella trichopoda]ERN20396.1 hypothetical protein AMTR_s00068p00073260 [Amborella trichopoda]|eukprot:XP_006858929.1 uncharacterized protein LOC18448812 [Amborella trichopoda]